MSRLKRRPGGKYTQRGRPAGKPYRGFAHGHGRLLGALPVRHVGAARFVQQAFSIEDMPAPLATLAALLRRSACEAIGAAVVKLLKAAHAAGTGSGRQRVLTSRREIVRHVQRSPLALCEGRFTNPALLREENVIGQVIDHCIEREYAAADPERREMIYYVP